MPSCGSNLTVMALPVSNDSCGTGAVSSDCCLLGEIGPRPKREAVRESLRDYILHMLGAPRIRIELTEQNIDFCIDQALQHVEEYAPREYFDWYSFKTTAGVSVYELPPDVGYVRNVSYMDQGNYSYMASQLGGQIPLEYFYNGGAYSSFMGGQIDPITPIWGRMAEWALYKMYEQTYTRLASRIGGWEFVGGHRHIKLYPVPCSGVQVSVQYLQRCKDWECVTIPMKQGALIFAKFILGRVRSWVKNPPGPNGGLQLDGDTLLQEAKEDYKTWLEDLNNRWGDVLPVRVG